MASEMQNLNPTILNAADLPTRIRNTNIKSSGDNFDETIFNGAISLTVHDPFASQPYPSSESESEDGDLYEEPIDEQEIFGTQNSFCLYPLEMARFQNRLTANPFLLDLISTISDPEHPIPLGSLAVVSLPDIAIKPSLPSNPNSPLRTVTVLITPTITHCSLATVIGLGVRVRLEQSLPPRFRIDVRIKEGTHSTADEVNKQLSDKERVAAALENGTLMTVISKMLETCQ